MDNEHDEMEIVTDHTGEEVQPQEGDGQQGEDRAQEEVRSVEKIQSKEEFALQEAPLLDLEEVEWIDDGITAEVETGPRLRHRRLIIGLCIAVAAVLAGYLYMSYYFTLHYLPGTIVNGIDCSYMTAEELGDAIQSGVSDYQLDIVERGDIVETIYGSSFGIRAVYGDALEEFLDEQEQYKWPQYIFSGDQSEHDAGDAVAWDEEKFSEVIYDLECMDPENMIDPQDAEILFSEENEMYYIQPAVYGTRIITDVFEELVTDAVSGLDESVDLDEAGCYEQPELTEESEDIVSACDKLNLMISTDITYDMVDIESVHIPKETIRSWVVLGDDLEVSCDEEAIATYVAGFAENYNTADRSHKLTTTWGPSVTLSTGSYGWRLDQEGEVAQIIEELEAGETAEREPVWSKKAASHGANDYGSTYVEINLTAQYLYYYKNGELIIETPFVSGMMTEDRMTHEGVYSVYYMESPAVLRGDDYETDVTFWMPFNGGEGMHDATWRSSFGGEIYVNNGSHGCINLPYSAAETIYENMSIGTCVIVYWLDGTSGSAANGVHVEEEEETVEEETEESDGANEE